MGGRSRRLAAAAAVVAALSIATLAVSGCWGGAPKKAATLPTAAPAPVPTQAASATPPAEATAPPAPAPAPKPKPVTPPEEKVTRESAAAAIMDKVNSSASMGSNADAKFTAIHIKVFEQSSGGTWYVGATMDNNLDGGIVFAKKAPGKSWVIIDSGTGIDGSEMAGQAPASIAAKFKAAFPQ